MNPQQWRHKVTCRIICEWNNLTQYFKCQVVFLNLYYQLKNTQYHFSTNRMVTFYFSQHGKKNEKKVTALGLAKTQI